MDNGVEIPKEVAKKFINMFHDIIALCDSVDGMGDPFSYGRGKEIYMACLLNHKVAKNLLGADGIDQDGSCEYKSTTTADIKGTYNGIMRYDTWEEQQRYLEEVKFGGYNNHYFGRFDANGIVELYHMDKQPVMDILIPKVEKQYPTTLEKKDPRLGVSMTKTSIYKYGTKLDHERLMAINLDIH